MEHQVSKAFHPYGYVQRCLIDTYYWQALVRFETIEACTKAFAEMHGKPFMGKRLSVSVVPANIFLPKFNNRNTTYRWEMCSKLTIKTSEQRHWHHSVVFIVKFENISNLFVVFLLTLNRQMSGGLFIVCYSHHCYSHHCKAQ